MYNHVYSCYSTGHSTSTTLIVYDVILSHMTSLPHIQEGDYAKRLNTSLAFFIHDAFSLMDRGIVFILIKTYLKKVHEHVCRPAMVFQLSYITCLSLQFTLSVKDLNLPEYRLDFLRIVCSHEHYVILNLPLGTFLYPMGAGSQQSSPSGSISSTFENLDMPNVEAMGELSHEFRHFHYLSGLVLSELAQVLVDGKSVIQNTHTVFMIM